MMAVPAATLREIPKKRTHSTNWLKEMLELSMRTGSARCPACVHHRTARRADQGSPDSEQKKSVHYSYFIIDKLNVIAKIIRYRSDSNQPLSAEQRNAINQHADRNGTEISCIRDRSRLNLCADILNPVDCCDFDILVPLAEIAVVNSRGFANAIHYQFSRVDNVDGLKSLMESIERDYSRQPGDGYRADWLSRKQVIGHIAKAKRCNSPVLLASEVGAIATLI